MLKGFEVMALDKDFNIVQLLRYTVLQWSRKYYESGTFSLEIPLSQYDASFKYIYTNARPEMGIITQVNYIVTDSYKSMNVSGYFLENQLNKRIAYKYCTQGNLINTPNWTNQKGKAEDVAFTYFSSFKDLEYTLNGQQYKTELGIKAGASLGRGHISDHERGSEKLGDKIYTILKPSKMSYRVEYDFLSNEMVFNCWQGLDRTQDNIYGNNPVIFSTKYGNIKKPDVLLDSSEYKNSVLVINTYQDEAQREYTVIEAVNKRLSDETPKDDAFSVIGSSLNHDDYSNTQAFLNAMITEGNEEITKNVKTINIEFSALEGSYEYMDDFDLGDICSIEIAELNLSADAVLIGCYEVIKEGVITLTLEFDTPESINGGI